jgi:hypothetical protein
MERWKDISGYEGLYQISSRGNVKSLERMTKHWQGGLKLVAERILKPAPDEDGYLMVCLNKEGKRHTIKISHLVWDHFGDTPRTKNDRVDHKDNIKAHNWIENFQLLSNRQNVSKAKLRYSKTSEFTGVSWHKGKRKWQAAILVNGKHQYLGRFKDEIHAAQAYQTALQNHLAIPGNI